MEDEIKKLKEDRIELLSALLEANSLLRKHAPYYNLDNPKYSSIKKTLNKYKVPENE